MQYATFAYVVKRPSLIVLLASFQVTVEATLEHPFFVFGQGWSSCQPERTQQRYVLSCHRLSVGDVCISLTHKNVTSRAVELTSRQGAQQGTMAPSANQISGGTIGAPTTHHDPASSSLTTSTSPTSSASPHKVPADTSVTGQKIIETDIDVDTHSQDSPLAPAPTAEGRPDSPDSGTGSTRKRRWSAPDQISADDSPGDASSHHQEEEGHQGQAEGQSKPKSGIKEEPSSQA